MEGYHGSTGRSTDLGIFDEVAEAHATGFKDETAEEPHAFSYQADLVELDKLFGELPGEHADVFVSAILWDEEQDARTGESIRIAPGELLVPYRLRLGNKGQLQFLVWWSREEGHRAPLVVNRSTLEDLLPATYAKLEEKFLQHNSRLIYLLERENKAVIGSRNRVIESLNTAIKTRSEVDLLKEMQRREEERTQSYADDDRAGMF